MRITPGSISIACPMPSRRASAKLVSGCAAVTGRGATRGALFAVMVLVPLRLHVFLARVELRDLQVLQQRVGFRRVRRQVERRPVGRAWERARLREAEALGDLGLILARPRGELGVGQPTLAAQRAAEQLDRA